MKRGEVWWVNFDPSLGGEIKKTRPAVILSNDISNVIWIEYKSFLSRPMLNAFTRAKRMLR